MSPPSTTRAAGAAWWLQGWQHVIFLVLNLLTGTVAVVLLSLILVGAAGLLAAGAGVVLLIPGMWGAWLLAQGELARIEVFTGTRIRPEPPSQENRWFHYLGISRAHRRAAIYTAVHALWGLVSGALIAGLTAAVVAVLAMPLYASRIPEEGLALLWFRLDSFNTQAVLWGAALGLLLVLPLLARQITAVDRQLARSLLGVDPDAEIAQLSERVETLTSSREETVDSVEAERRRIERDLHDGPQQRLVAIAMDLGMARERLASDPEGARELLDKAHVASKEAIVAMRQVARGITPPILADRGLSAAVSALAARSPVPVEVEASEVGRLDPTTEAIAYFCVSELLTNVAKHGHANHTSVRMTRTSLDGPPRLALEVTDDGVGGADPTRGTGLAGLRQRLAAVDGAIQISSPVGGPTHAVVTIPERPVRTLRGENPDV